MKAHLVVYRKLSDGALAQVGIYEAESDSEAIFKALNDNLILDQLDTFVVEEASFYPCIKCGVEIAIAPFKGCGYPNVKHTDCQELSKGIEVYYSHSTSAIQTWE